MFTSHKFILLRFTILYAIITSITPIIFSGIHEVTGAPIYAISIILLFAAGLDTGMNYFKTHNALPKGAMAWMLSIVMTLIVLLCSNIINPQYIDVEMTNEVLRNIIVGLVFGSVMATVFLRSTLFLGAKIQMKIIARGK